MQLSPLAVLTTLGTPMCHVSAIFCRRSLLFLLSVLGALIGGCSSTSISVDPGPSLDAQGRWALLPIVNLTDTPLAADRTEAILASLLQARGLTTLGHSPNFDVPGEMPILDDQERFERALAWARREHYDYAIAGSAVEWNYKSGVEREPAVGISLRAVDVPTGKVLWSATGAHTGTGRESLAGTAQQLLTQMLASLKLQMGKL
jgi:hypothetical protein